MCRVCPLSWRAARAVASRHQTPPIARCFPVGAVCTQSPAPAWGCFCARACPLPRRAPSAGLSRHQTLPLPAVPPWRSLCTASGPRRGCFCAGYALCPGGQPGRSLPGTRHPYCLPLSHGRSLHTAPGPRRGLFCARACPLSHRVPSAVLSRHHPVHDVRRSPMGATCAQSRPPARDCF